MKHAKRIAENLPVYGLRAELELHPELWDKRTLRTAKGGPFDGTSDIWLRYRDPRTVKEPSQWNEPHQAVWYLDADLLPAAKSLSQEMMNLCGADTLGGVLLTRIPAGKEVKWHTDKGGWHAQHYPLKVYVIVQGNEDCINYFEDEQMVMRTGEAWLFDNLVRHAVVNNGTEDRISLIVCMRKENA